ncbi:MAG: hypothetical protein ACOC5B_03240 [Myxococcota bacterium]
MTDIRFFGNRDIDTVVGVVMELAAQLHEERAHRIALQVALEEAGMLQPGAVEEASEVARDRIRAELDTAVAGLVRVMAESGPPEHPMRHEARDDAWAADHV